MRLDVRHALRADAARARAPPGRCRGPARWPAPTAMNTVPGRAIRSLDPARPGGVAVGEDASGGARGSAASLSSFISAASRSTSPVDQAVEHRRQLAGDLVILLERLARAARSAAPPASRRSMRIWHSNPSSSPIGMWRASAARVSTVSGPFAALMPSSLGAEHRPGSSRRTRARTGRTRPAGTPSRAQRPVRAPHSRRREPRGEGAALRDRPHSA